MCEYYPPLENLPIFDVTVFRLAQDVVGFALNTGNINVNNATSGTSFYPTFVDTSSGYQRIRTNAPAYTYNANTNTISANTSGSSGSASTIALTSDDTSGTYWIPFSKTTSTISNALYIDDTTTPLSYNPDTSTLTATNFDGLSSGSITIDINEYTAPSTAYNLTFTTLGAGQKNLLIDTASFGIGLNYEPDSGTLNCVNFQGVASNAYLVRASDSNPMIATIYYLPFVDGASAGYYDLNVTTNLFYDFSTQTLSAGNFDGLASRSTNIAGGGAGFIPYQSASDITTFVDPTSASNDYVLTWETATTQPVWKINAATSANTVLVTDDNSNSTFYPIFASTGAGQKSLLFDTTTNPLSYNPQTSTLTASNFNGLASSASTVAVAVDNSPTVYYPTFTSTGAGQKALLFDTTTNPLSYQPSNSTLTATTFSGTATRSNLIDVSSVIPPADIYNIPFCLGTGAGTQLRSDIILQYDTTGGINQITANLNGNASSATQVKITADDTGTTFYPIFAASGGGNKALLYDTTTTPLAYVPNTNTLTVNNLSSVAAITPSNGSSISLNGTPIGNGGNINTVCMGVSAGNSSMPNNNFCFGTNAGRLLSTAGGFQSGVQNLCIGANSGSSLTFGKFNCFLGASAARFTTTGTNNTQIGSQTQTFPDNNLIGSYNTTIGSECHISVDGLTHSTAIGANVVASTSNTVRIGRAADTTIFDGPVTNTTGQPAASDSSTRMPTTAWVQTAVTAGSVTTAANIALTGDNTSGTYYIPFSKTTSATSNALYIDNTTTPLVYNPSNNELSATQFSLGGLAPATGANAGLFAQNIGSSATVIQNQATSGSIFFNTRTALNALTTSLSISTTAATFSSTAIFNGPNISVSGTTINFGQGAGGASNFICGNTDARNKVFTTGANTIIGTSAGNSMTIAASNNTCLGSSSGTGITSASNNTFIGGGAGFQTANGTGNNNTCVGFVAGDSMTTTATQNTLIGSDSASALTSGTGNTVMGFGAAGALLTGISNTIIGLQAGDLITGSFNTCIGSGSSVPNAAGSNQIAIGTPTENLYIQGGLSYQVQNITGNVTLTFPFPQFYTLTLGANNTITLPAPILAHRGAVLKFKRNTGAFATTITSTGAGLVFKAFNSIGAFIATASLPAANFYTELICDGSGWYQLTRV